MALSDARRERWERVLQDLREARFEVACLSNDVGPEDRERAYDGWRVSESLEFVEHLVEDLLRRHS